MRTLANRLALLAAALILPLAAASEEDPRPRIRIVTVEDPPVIDGSLDDPVWQRAAVLGALTQVDPVEGAKPTERTVVRVLRDADQLYLGIRCYDSEPDEIIARIMLRDASMINDDRISLVFDTFHDRRNGFFFQLNPRGNRRDALVEGNRFDEDWDGIWYAKAAIDDEGWTLEFALPFKTVSFDPDTDTWGFNILRSIRRRNELLRWADPHVGTSFINVGEAGVIEGMRGIQQGLGLDVLPSVTLRHVDDGIAHRSYTAFDPSINLFYKVLPSFTASLTANTDFGETEVDERQVNLTRFSLFFPEKRSFFLQDAGIFSFAGIAEENGIPFFSRTVGRSATGDPVDIRAAAKATGRIGRFNIGLLDAQLKGHDGIESKNLSIGRISANVLRESTVGMIATHGDPLSNRDNGLIGTDFNYRNSEFFSDRTVEGNLWLEHSFTSNRNDDQFAYGMKLAYPNDQIKWNFRAFAIDRQFFPALGFVNRTGIRNYNGEYRYRIRPQDGAIRTFDLRTKGLIVTDTSNELESSEAEVFPIEARNELGDFFQVILKHEFDRVNDGGFPIHPKFTIPKGLYDWYRFGALLRGSEARRFGGEIAAGWGGFYDGRLFSFQTKLRYRPSQYLLVGVEYDHRRVSVRAGRFTDRVVRIRMNLQLNADISWVTFAQYDNRGDSVGINSRLRWIFEPGRELFIVLNQGVFVHNWSLRLSQTEPLVKLGWTFRF